MAHATGRDEAPASPGLPSSPERIPAIFEWFARMREGHPVVHRDRSGMAAWHVYRYDDVTTALTDHARFSSDIQLFNGSPLGDTLLVKDPPDHRKLRNLVNMAFTPRAVAQLADRVGEITQELIDAVSERGEMDVVSDIAFPLPARVIAEMLGVPDSDWDLFRRWAQTEGMGSGGAGASSMRTLTDYFGDLLRDRRRRPRADLVTALSTAEVDGERLTEHELVSFCTLLLLAGQETTKNLIANFFLSLSDHPDDQALLTLEPALMPTAIEEVLRTLPPVWFVFRRTTTEVELGGVRIPADQIVMPWLASANRDSSQFPEPDRFDVRREPNRHLGFGHGVHFCVGAPLSRLESRIALPMLLEQLPDLHVRRDLPIRIRAGIVFIIDRLQVAFRAA
jgi:cytochrome P450